MFRDGDLDRLKANNRQIKMSPMKKKLLYDKYGFTSQVKKSLSESYQIIGIGNKGKPSEDYEGFIKCELYIISNGSIHTNNHPVFYIENKLCKKMIEELNKPVGEEPIVFETENLLMSSDCIVFFTENDTYSCKEVKSLGERKLIIFDKDDGILFKKIGKVERIIKDEE